MSPLDRTLTAAVLTLSALAAHAAVGPGQANGTIAHKGKTVVLKHAYYVTGTNMGFPLRQVVLSATDIGPAMAADDSLLTAGNRLREGIIVYIDEGKMLRYWMAISDQTEQVSTMFPAKEFTATANDAKRVAGKLAFDHTRSGGPKVDVEFDARLLKEFE